MDRSKKTRICVNSIKSNANRIIELLEDEIPEDDLSPYSVDNMNKISELKVKMAELRRDTLRLEKLIYRRSI